MQSFSILEEVAEQSAAACPVLHLYRLESSGPASGEADPSVFYGQNAAHRYV